MYAAFYVCVFRLLLITETRYYVSIDRSRTEKIAATTRSPRNFFSVTVTFLAGLNYIFVFGKLYRYSQGNSDGP